MANRTYQVDFLQELYQILIPFQEYKAGNIPKDNPRLLKSIAKYKNLNEELFNHSEFEFGDQIHELFLMRGDIERPSDLKKGLLPSCSNASILTNLKIYYVNMRGMHDQT